MVMVSYGDSNVEQCWTMNWGKRDVFGGLASDHQRKPGKPRNLRKLPKMALSINNAPLKLMVSQSIRKRATYTTNIIWIVGFRAALALSLVFIGCGCCSWTAVHHHVAKANSERSAPRLTCDTSPMTCLRYRCVAWPKLKHFHRSAGTMIGRVFSPLMPETPPAESPFGFSKMHLYQQSK